MSFPYSVSWSPNLGNYYSNVGQGNISLAGYTLLNSISGVSCDAWIYNNGHSIAGTGSGELNQYFIVGGIWKTWSTPFTMNGNWNV